MEPNYDDDFWADHDENCHGIIDTDEMRKEYPEGFLYTCCDKDGEAKGCARARHEEHPNKSRKGSCEALSSDLEGEDDSEGGDGESDDEDD